MTGQAGLVDRRSFLATDGPSPDTNVINDSVSERDAGVIGVSSPAILGNVYSITQVVRINVTRGEVGPGVDQNAIHISPGELASRKAEHDMMPCAIADQWSGA